MKESKAETRRGSGARRKEKKPKIAGSASGRTRPQPRNAGITLMASVEEPREPYVSAEKLLRLYKPRKKKVTLRLDADVLEWFRKDGKGYQTRINRALRRLMRLEMKERE